MPAHGTRRRAVRRRRTTTVLAAALVLSAGACTVDDAWGGDQGVAAPSAGSRAAVPVLEVEVGDEPLVRRNVKDLSADERRRFVDAVKALKATPSPHGDGVGNWYDRFVAMHLSKLICWSDEDGVGGYGHNGPDLITWHRAFLRDFEQALSTVSGSPIALPYWDWTDPDSTEAVFAEDFMGPLGDPDENFAVTAGPFAADVWTIHVKGFEVHNPGQFDHIVRANTSDATLPTSDDVDEALRKPEYDVAPWSIVADDQQSFRSWVDGNIGATGTECTGGVLQNVGMHDSRIHGAVHMWVGGSTDDGDPGTLADTLTSPNDPVFWLHHAAIDRLAESWWVLNDWEYAPDGEGPDGENRDDAIWPYDEFTNGDMARPTVELGYLYDRLIEPTDRSGEAAAPPTPSGRHGAHGTASGTG